MPSVFQLALPQTSIAWGSEGRCQSQLHPAWQAVQIDYGDDPHPPDVVEMVTPRFQMLIESEKHLNEATDMPRFVR